MFFSRGVRPRTTSNLLDMIIEYLSGQSEEDNLEDIINQIMMEIKYMRLTRSVWRGKRRKKITKRIRENGEETENTDRS